MNIDVDGSREIKNSINLGIPRRAWMFSSMSNERDRPSLTLPHIAPFVSTLETFGWRSSRQSPQTVREEEATVLQPAIIANGTCAFGEPGCCLWQRDAPQYRRSHQGAPGRCAA